MTDAKPLSPLKNQEPTRRDFLILTTAAMGAVGTAGLLWPFIDSMNPSADVLALSTVDVDLKALTEGQSITVMWQGKPVFIRYRTPKEIEEARAVALSDLPDPQEDTMRVQKDPRWLIVVGVCTHLGCVPLGQKTSDPRGKWGGWYCPCHGSEYDTSGRIRKGPAPHNLVVPAYKFLTETSIRIGVSGEEQQQAKAHE